MADKVTIADVQVGMDGPTGVSNISANDQALAAAVNAERSVGPVSLTPMNGATAYAKNPPVLRREGGRVFMDGALSTIPTAAGTQIFTIPAGYVPAQYTPKVIPMKVGEGSFAIIDFGDDGKIGVEFVGGTVGVLTFAGISWPTNDDFPN